MTQRGLLLLVFFLAVCAPKIAFGQGTSTPRDTIVYHYIFRDTIVYRYDTVRVNRYVQYDTLWNGPRPPSDATPKRKGWYNPNSWGIGPTLGAYYSPYHGFDINIGFGIQYYLFAVPSFRNPHMGHRKPKK